MLRNTDCEQEVMGRRGYSVGTISKGVSLPVKTAAEERPGRLWACTREALVSQFWRRC